MAKPEGANAHSISRPVTLDCFAAAVANFVGQRSGVAPALITPDYDYIARGLLDSLGTMDLFLFVEETFGVKFPIEDFDIAKANTAATFYSYYLSAEGGDSLAAAS